MGIQIVTSLAQAEARGVYGIFQRELAAVQGVGTARAVMLCQLPWGPVGLAEDGDLADFDTPANFRAKFCPAGFTRTGSPYNLATRFAWADLKIIRVLASDAVKATINLQKAGALDCVAAPAKYYGAEGNGITCVVAAASDGVANSFDLTVTKLNSTTGKSTAEKYPNVDSTRTDDAYWTALTANSVLLGPLKPSDVGRPVNGTYTLAAGTDGAAIVASDYLGTPGSADKGLALCEKDQEISFIFLGDDPGAGLRATINAGLAAHQALMNDRRHVLLTGAADETDATARTNAALNPGEQIHYITGFGKVVDEDATSDTSPLIQVPLTGAFAGFCSIIQPHVSPAVKRKEFTKYFAPIKGLTNGTGTPGSLATNEKNGVVSFEKNSNGVFSPYCGVATDKLTQIFVSRMRRYIMFSLGFAIEDYRNSPNADTVQDDERTITETFLEQLVTNGKGDVFLRPAVKAAALLPEESANTTVSENAGDYAIPAEVQLFNEQRRLIIQVRAGVDVTVTVAAA